MTLTYHLRTPCHLCGYRRQGIYMVTARINRRSIRHTGYWSIGASMPCPECHDQRAGRYVAEYTASVLSAESWADVQAYRERRWAA